MYWCPTKRGITWEPPNHLRTTQSPHFLPADSSSTPRIKVSDGHDCVAFGYEDVWHSREERRDQPRFEHARNFASIQQSQHLFQWFTVTDLAPFCRGWNVSVLHCTLALCSSHLSVSSTQIGQSCFHVARALRANMQNLASRNDCFSLEKRFPSPRHEIVLTALKLWFSLNKSIQKYIQKYCMYVQQNTNNYKHINI